MDKFMQTMKEIFAKQSEELSEKMAKQSEGLSEKMAKQSAELCEKITEQNRELSKQNKELSEKMEKQSEQLSEQNKKLSAKFERLETHIEEKLCQQEQRLQEKLCQQEQRLEEKLSQQEQRLREEFETKLRAYEQRLQVLLPVITPATKPARYDGTTSWSVYKTQFEVIAEANEWRTREKACCPAASLRSPAADVLQTLPEEKRLDYESLVSALDLRFGGGFLPQLHAIQLRNRTQKPQESLHELASDVERLARLAYANCPEGVQDQLAQQHFVDAIGDLDTQQSVRMADCTSLRSAVVHAMKFESTRLSYRN
ncbi:hypothetical protein JGG87_25120 [Salmonella enterica subsp. enterica serovar Typhimurium]|nr:hypothetical protein [Salmonella enterica subsp. enterica serovar Typhimurium]